MRITDIFEIAAAIASGYSVYQNEIFQVVALTLLTESTDSRGQLFATASKYLEDKAKAQTTPTEVK